MGTTPKAAAPADFTADARFEYLRDLAGCLRVHFRTTLASGYMRAGLSDSYFLATTGSVSVPEPAAWALMIMGFGLVGAAIRGRRGRHIA